VRFSIVIPTHQRREIVQRTLRAVSNQEHDDFEVIVVIDGSTDGTADALRKLNVPFPLTVLEQPTRGAAAARNAGAAAASGEVLLFLDDDMEAHPALLTEHDRSLRRGAELVLGDLPLHPDSPANVLSAGVESWARSRRERLAADPNRVPLEDLLTGQMSIPRQTFERIGGFDADFTRGGLFGGEDLDFGYRVLKAGCGVEFNPGAVSYQYFDVDPGDFLRREYQAGRSAQELALKHPERAAELSGNRRLRTRRARWLVGPLAIAPRPMTWPIRVGIAALVRTGRGGPRLQRAFRAVRTMEHVRGMRDTRRAVSTGRVAVLAYHAISDLRDDEVLGEYGVPGERFAEQLDALVRWGWTFVDLDTLLRALDGRVRLPSRSILLTFDDAYADLLSEGLPALVERRAPGIVFAVADRVGDTNEWDLPLGARELRLLDAEALKTVIAGGVEVGSHTSSHRPLTQLSPGELTAELEGSAERLAALGLPKPRALSYPYGETTSKVGAAASRAGYTVAFTVRPGLARRGVDRLAVPRIEVFAGDTPGRLRLKLATAEWPPRLRRWALRLVKTR
jgi:glycosyltransferase involved in cell wall biosynthesis/peptidoglycan/xylan/chitin deacetylase (PgdA/CDA1 family)